LAAAGGDATGFAPRVEQWVIQELTLRSQRAYSNPFADVGVQARFRSQGVDITVDGFYDGDQTWMVRIMPQALGTWTFATVSADPDLDGRSGSLAVDMPSPGNHGPVVVHTLPMPTGRPTSPSARLFTTG
jgi:hypothetical protein